MKHKTVQMCKKMASRILCLIYKMTYKFISIDKKMAIFISFHGRSYSDNPRAIYEAMRQDKKFDDFQYVWVLKRKNKGIDIPGNPKRVVYLSLSYFYYMAKTKYWVINCKMPEFMYKKKNQIYLQTWHGAPLKRLAHDFINNEGDTFYRSEISFDEFVRQYDIDVAKYNYLISSNLFSTDIFERAFRIERSRIIQTGYPRVDYILNASFIDQKNIKIKYGIPMDKKVVTYAPTFRDGDYQTNGYVFNLKVDFKKWKDILGDGYVVVFKPHYLIVTDFKDDPSLKGFLYYAEAESDINDLYIISDYFITDYSSSFFDYSVLDKPIYFYMYDLEEYSSQLRGIYLDIYKDLPGDIYKEEISMIRDIKNHTYNQKKLDLFNARFNQDNTGDCSQKVIDIVFNTSRE